MYGGQTVEHKPNLLTLWTSGLYAKDMEALSEEKVLRHAVENVHRFLDKQYNVTEPVAMLRTRWFSNPHFKGGYSYRSLESDKWKVYPDMLEKPLIPQNLVCKHHIFVKLGSSLYSIFLYYTTFRQFYLPAKQHPNIDLLLLTEPSVLDGKQQID